MGRLLWLPDVLSAAGVRVRVEPGWDTRGAPSMLDRPLAVMQHHTAGVGDGVLRVVRDGRSDLPGPLCHLFPRVSGEVAVVASGKANHAGVGKWPGLRDSTQIVGLENEHSGSSSSPWPPAQMAAIEKATAAILGYCGRGAEWSIGHKEWATPAGRKPDPTTWDMSAHRARLHRLMHPVSDPRSYRMVCYARPGSRDLAALREAQDSVRAYGVMTNDLGEAQAAIRRGETVVGVGGPACTDLFGGAGSATGTYAVGPHVAVRGSTGDDTHARVLALAANGWRL